MDDVLLLDDAKQRDLMKQYSTFEEFEKDFEEVELFPGMDWSGFQDEDENVSEAGAPANDHEDQMPDTQPTDDVSGSTGSSQFGGEFHQEINHCDQATRATVHEPDDDEIQFLYSRSNTSQTAAAVPCNDEPSPATSSPIHQRNASSTESQALLQQLTPGQRPTPKASPLTISSSTQPTELSEVESPTASTRIQHQDADAAKLQHWDATRQMVSLVDRDDEAKNFVPNESFLTECQIWEALQAGVLPLLDLEEGEPDEDARTISDFDSVLKCFIVSIEAAHDAKPRKKWSTDQQESYEIGQENARRNIINKTNTKALWDIAVLQIKRALLECFKLHRKGVVAAYLEDNVETGMKCSERLNKMMEVVAQNKLIALDLISGHVDVLLYSPQEALRRKLANVSTNTRKQGLLDSEKKREQTETGSTGKRRPSKKQKAAAVSLLPSAQQAPSTTKATSSPSMLGTSVKNRSPRGFAGNLTNASRPLAQFDGGHPQVQSSPAAGRKRSRQEHERGELSRVQPPVKHKRAPHPESRSDQTSKATPRFPSFPRPAPTPMAIKTPQQQSPHGAQYGSDEVTHTYQATPKGDFGSNAKFDLENRNGLSDQELLADWTYVNSYMQPQGLQVPAGLKDLFPEL